MKTHSGSVLLLMGAISFPLVAAEPNGSYRKVDGQPPEAKEDAVDQAAVQKAPKDAEARYRWNLSTLVDEYERIGHKNPKWDEPAKRALQTQARARSYGGGGNTNFWNGLRGALREAVSAGCDDPMVKYLHNLLVVGVASRATKETVSTYIEVARQMQQSKYPEVRKFYASLRAAQATKAAAGKGTPLEVHKFRMEAMGHLIQVVDDKTIPVGEIYDACSELLRTCRLNKREENDFFDALEPILLTNWVQEASIHLLRGDHYVDYAWQARGNGYASTVTPEGWRGFEERLAIAQECLEKAWKLDPSDKRIPLTMLTLELGQGQGRERMEMWFRRAMELDPNYYQACWKKLYYLAPKWYGSVQDVLDFGRECAASDKWGGRVPLILLEAHVHLAAYEGEAGGGQAARLNYWKRPGVWADVKTSFEKFFRLHPEAVGYRAQYARYACLCEQWDEANKQLSLVGPVNYEDFGGKEKYDVIVRLAKEHADKAGK